MKRAALIAGAAVLGAGWGLAAGNLGLTGHMTAHMLAVSISAPLIAYALAGTHADPTIRWPRLITPVLMSMVELLVVWGWHLPVARAFVARSAAGLALEQATFLIAGLLLWSGCLGTRHARSNARRASGVVAMLLTTMHMTLLGVLVTLAPRVLFATSGLTCLGLTLSPLADQQVAGIIMLSIGSGSYLIGGLVLLAQLLRNDTPGISRQWS